MNLLPGVPASDSRDDALYNIGAVTRMTGISMPTLRAWERRYDFPDSKRTAGGHRLYSDKDIMRLRWVKSRIEEGMQTSQAIHALRYLESSDQEVLQQPQESDLTGSKIHPDHSANIHYKDLLFNALSTRNLNMADQIIGEALVHSSVEDVILSIIGPTMSLAGDAWENQTISVATEHFITNFLRQRLLMWMVSSPESQRLPPIILACAPEEYHEGSLLILGALLRRKLLPVIYLGQAVPLQDMATFIRTSKPSIVVIVAMTEKTAGELTKWPEMMPEVFQTGKPRICFGGKIFGKAPEWQHRISGVFLGETIEQGMNNIERMLYHGK